MRLHAIFVLVAFVCAHAATIKKRDAPVIQEISNLEVAGIQETEKKLPTATDVHKESQKPEENHSSAEELIQQTIPIDQINNELRSPVNSEVHIPVKIVHDVRPVLKVDPEVVKDTDTNKDKESENEVNVPHYEDIIEEQAPPPGIIQQGIQTIQALQQAAAISIQNAIRPQNDESSGTGSNFFQQSFQNLQNSFQNGIQSLNQTVSNFLSGNQETQGDEATTNQNIISTLQHNFQNSLAQLNQTFQNVIHPPQGVKRDSNPANLQKIAEVENGIIHLKNDFQVGLKSASEGINVITSVKQSPPATETGTPPSSNPLNAFQQFIQSWQQSFQTNVQSLNSTIQNFFTQNQNGQTQADDATNRPNIVQQGLQNFQQSIQNFQNFLSGQQPPQAQSDESTATNKPTNVFAQGFQQIQNIFAGQQNNQGSGSTAPQVPVNAIQQGLQTLLQNFQNGINSLQNAIQNRPQETPPAVPVSDASAIAQKIPAALPANETTRKKGGGGGNSGNNNNSGSSRIEAPKSEVQKPEVAPVADNLVNPEATKVLAEQPAVSTVTLETQADPES